MPIVVVSRICSMIAVAQELLEFIRCGCGQLLFARREEQTLFSFLHVATVAAFCSAEL